FDDCLGVDNRFFYHKVFDDIAYNGRHFNFTMIISIQYCMEMPPRMRSQLDYIVSFQETNLSNKKRLYNYLFGVFDDYKGFEKTLNRCTINYECFILDTTVN